MGDGDSYQYIEQHREYHIQEALGEGSEQIARELGQIIRRAFEARSVSQEVRIVANEYAWHAEALRERSAALRRKAQQCRTSAEGPGR